MFSPVYEDVSGLFGRPTPVTGYGPVGELHFPPARFTSGSGSQPSSTQQQSQQSQQSQQQQQQQMRAAFSLMDAAGSFAPQQQSQSQQQSQQNLAASLNGISFNTLNGSPIIPLEVFLQQQQSSPQQQQQASQLTAFSGKPGAFQTTEGVKYFLSAPPSGTPMLATGQAAGLLRQQGGGGGSTVYTIDPSSASALAQTGPFFQPSNTINSISNGLQNGNGDFSFFVANGLPTATAFAVNTGASTGMQAGIANLPPDQFSRTLVNPTPSLNLQASANRNVTVAELVGNKTSIEVFDPDFKYIYNVSTNAVVHLPPARLNITRLVLCRNYRPCDPRSCAMGGNCKFVHADCDYAKLEAHPIHVNYIWRHESLCTYPRLPPGEKRSVLQADGQVIEVPTERLLVTKGAQSSNGTPINSCDSYESNGMCYQGERCSCLHVVVVDPNVKGDFKRASRKRELPNGSSGTHAFTAAVVQHSGSTTSCEHSRTASQVLPALTSQQQLYAQQRQHTGSPETETSTSSNNTRPAVRSGTATQQTTPAEPMLPSTTLARLQEAVAMQLHTPAAPNPQPIAPSFGISLTPFALQTLTNTTSAGTLLYLPRGAVEAIVMGPVGSVESAKGNSNGGKTPCAP
ncbi:hypothetical protein ABB37_06223 [Leptomonas pyrrhocoris]|uniref:C3H1-type domain-containing protein n=1 Tax=Leptomonas pyrrhocoris TaxID=157538 RepID=A0A0M9FYK8_LEPPY|nr:hypothetical protein ABB37_06223 [Leptomonas pyrrhocoris]KPA78623.1 hypothetical protein ABB37_06223 [Leptomonas pyrrhocoris]|eukprot:XP_015657062.1 hypothetical protein ABB37_06223 [Leptomonas pyrrhocoris]